MLPALVSEPLEVSRRYEHPDTGPRYAVMEAAHTQVRPRSRITAVPFYVTCLSVTPKRTDGDDGVLRLRLSHLGHGQARQASLRIHSTRDIRGNGHATISKNSERHSGQGTPRPAALQPCNNPTRERHGLSLSKPRDSCVNLDVHKHRQR